MSVDLRYACRLSFVTGEKEIPINLGGQTLERWPPELFVSEELANEALDRFLTTGKQDRSLHWVGIDAFPREIVWEGRAEKEAWERANPAKRRDV